MHVINFILYLLAAICFLIATIQATRPDPGPVARVNVLALGLLFWVLVPLIAAGRALD